MKQAIIDFIKNVFLSRKGWTWLVALCTQVYLTAKLAFFSSHDNDNILMYVFYIIIANIAVQLIALGFIHFSKVKISANFGNKNNDC